jgi:dihydrofolate reductase
MRKIINSAFISLDGVTEDPSSWAVFDPDSGQEAAHELQALGGMLMGRGTYEYFADVMPKQTGPYADAINAIRKYVFSSTLETADWNNSTIIDDDVITAVTELKQHDGGDLMMYGRGRLSQTLLENHLVDEIRFSVHPVLVGGRPVGAGNGQTLPLKLLGATPSPSGVVALTYVPRSSRAAIPHPRTGTTEGTGVQEGTLHASGSRAHQR